MMRGSIESIANLPEERSTRGGEVLRWIGVTYEVTGPFRAQVV